MSLLISSKIHHFVAAILKTTNLTTDLEPAIQRLYNIQIFSPIRIFLEFWPAF